MAATRLLRWWPWLLALLIVAPLLRPGYVLSYDMVFVPHQAWRWSYLGWGPDLPRAVPSDALVSVLTSIVPGQLVQKAMLVTVLGVAGTTMTALVGTAPWSVRMIAATVYIWNPYVAERLALGQWVVLVAYAVLPAVLATTLDIRRGEHRLPRLTLLLALSGLSVSGGLMALTVVAVTLFWPGGTSGRQRLAAVLVGVIVNAPWWVAGLVHAGHSTSGRAAVDAFAAHAEGYLPAPLAALSLGGVWNTDVIPGSRTTWFAVVLSLAMVALSVIGVVVSRRARYPSLGVLIVFAVVGYVVAMASVVAPSAVAALTAHLPGAAAFRDGTRFLALFALPEAVFVGRGAEWVITWFRGGLTRAVVAGCLVVLPVAAMPDLAWGVGGDLSPVHYPASWTSARATMQAAGSNGRVLILPLSAYRASAWNYDRPVVDPAPRYFTGEMLSGDALYIDGRLVDENNPTARAAEQAVMRHDSRRLRSLGVGYVLVERDITTPAATEWLGRPLFESADIAVYRFSRTSALYPSARSLVVLLAAWLAAVGTVVLAFVSILWAALPKLRRDTTGGDSRRAASRSVDPS
jgi:hypothetical protein